MWYDAICIMAQAYCSTAACCGKKTQRAVWCRAAPHRLWTLPKGLTVRLDNAPSIIKELRYSVYNLWNLPKNDARRRLPTTHSHWKRCIVFIQLKALTSSYDHPASGANVHSILCDATYTFSMTSFSARCRKRPGDCDERNGVGVLERCSVERVTVNKLVSSGLRPIQSNYIRPLGPVRVQAFLYIITQVRLA